MTSIAMEPDIELQGRPAPMRTPRLSKSSTLARNDQKWESMKEDIRRIYVTEKKSLKDTMDEITELHTFRARSGRLPEPLALKIEILTVFSERKWKTKLKEWQFDKNLPLNVMGFVIAKAEKRVRNENKETVFYHRDSQISSAKIRNFKKRMTKTAAEGAPPSAKTPENITYYTPVPLPQSQSPLYKETLDTYRLQSEIQPRKSTLHSKSSDPNDESDGACNQSGDVSRSPSFSPSFSNDQPNGFVKDPQIPKAAQTDEYADVIDRGLITVDMATKMFNCYVDQLAPHMPAVIFPPNATAADVRTTKPTLFLAILSASSGINYPELQPTLTREVMSIYADRIILHGENALELVQALIISTLWYWPPEHFEEIGYYQLVHIAAVMAIDIGMGKKSNTSKFKNVGLRRDYPWRRTTHPDPEAIVARRAWLACYFLCCNASMGLCRPNLIRWTSFMADCIDVLEHSPEAASSDKAFCQWIRIQYIAEDIGTQFSMNDPVARVSIADSMVQYILKGCERDLEKWSSQIPPEVQSPPLRMTEHVVNLYMHEIAMPIDNNVEEFKAPFSEDTLRVVGEESESLTPAHISALSICLTSIDGIFRTFLELDAETVRCLPVAHFVRVAYAVVVLIKMYLAAATPNGQLGKVINKDNMRVEQYLDGLVEIFKAPAAGGEVRACRQVLDGFHHVEDLVPPPKRNPANNPLQLLSEVATGDQGGQSRPENNNYPLPPSDWQQQQQFPNYYPSMNQMAQNIAQGYGNVPMAGNIDPFMGMDLGYTMGDGFEQAIGITLEVGDFGNIFSNDAFFGSIMDL
ncbi:related to cercosporin resistance protein [Phialocephala subalpina]|uniref:Related to cercosporin resistance protein n=1 Tax=Phialocephala subalpina TaxID=576137 RepID=A0A1L7XCP2_9HELO|nr:related to cercosporin resistance protein [Phialocephala subalpina]